MSDDFFFGLIKVFDCLLQFKGVADQAAERAGQLIQRRLRQALGIHPCQNRLASLQHFHLQVKRQALALAFDPLAVAPPQVVLTAQPSIQRARWDLEEFADARHIAIVFVKLIQRVDLGT